MSSLGCASSDRRADPGRTGGSESGCSGLDGCSGSVDIVNKKQVFFVQVEALVVAPSDEGSAQVTSASRTVEAGLRPSRSAANKQLFHPPGAAAGQRASDFGTLVVAASP